MVLAIDLIYNRVMSTTHKPLRTEGHSVSRIHNQYPQQQVGKYCRYAICRSTSSSLCTYAYYN
jgi:hypothetical protein